MNKKEDILEAPCLESIRYPTPSLAANKSFNQLEKRKCRKDIISMGRALRIRETKQYG